MLKRYLVTENMNKYYFDDLNSAKRLAATLARLGHEAVIYETQYVYDPETIKKDEEPSKVYSEPWGWIN